MRTLIGAFCATALTAMPFVPTTASAQCTQTVYASHFYTLGSYSYIYGEPSAYGNTFTYYGYTTNSVFAATGASVVASRNRVTLVGDASSCPTSGTYQYIGSITNIYVNP
jgi:hypothetical protein